MPSPKLLNIGFPYGGVDHSQGFSTQSPQTTISALNVWPRKYPSGHGIGSTRPGITQNSSSPSGEPLNWCHAEWSGGRGIALVTKSDVYTTDDGVSWTSEGFGSVSTDFASVAVFLQTIFRAEGDDDEVYYKLLSGGSVKKLSDGVDTWGQGVAGTPPKKCGIVATHGDRLVLTGDTDNPHVVYFSAIGNPANWDYAADGADRAWANSSGEEGQISEPVTSVISHNRSCVLIGCTDSMYVIRGNPTVSGSGIEILSHEVGPLMQSAWCKTGSDHTVMMTRQGLYYMRPGCGDIPINMSDRALPDDLMAIDPENGDTVSLAYDGRFRGIHIYVTRNSGNAYYFYDIINGDLLHGGYWPMSFSIGDIRLAVNLKSASGRSQSGAIILPPTGGSYRFDTSSTESINSYLYYGPIDIGTPHTEGILNSVSAVLAKDSDNLDWDVYVGDSPQEAFYGSSQFSGEAWSVEGLNPRQYPRLRGSAAYIRVHGSGTTRWAIEELVGIAYDVSARRYG